MQNSILIFVLFSIIKYWIATYNSTHLVENVSRVDNNVLLAIFLKHIATSSL